MRTEGPCICLTVQSCSCPYMGATAPWKSKSPRLARVDDCLCCRRCAGSQGHHVWAAGDGSSLAGLTRPGSNQQRRAAGQGLSDWRPGGGILAGPPACQLCGLPAELCAGRPRVCSACAACCRCCKGCWQATGGSSAGKQECTRFRGLHKVVVSSRLLGANHGYVMHLR